MKKIYILLLSLFISFNINSEEEKESDPTFSPIIGSVNVITGTYSEASVDINLPGPKPLVLQRLFFGIENEYSPDGLAWHFNHPDILSSGITPIPTKPGKDIDYDYRYDSSNRLEKLSVYNKNKTKIYHNLSFNYQKNEDSLLCSVISPGGGTFVYNYHITEKSRADPELLIDSVTNSMGGTTKYTYRKHPQERKYLIKRIEDPEGGYLESEYYDNKYNNVGGDQVTIENFMRDPRIGRIKLQKAPLGPGNSTIITERYFYEKDYTDVIRSNGLKKRYHYSTDSRITKIETFCKGNAHGGILYRVERLYWKRSPDDMKSSLTSRTLEDRNGSIHTCETYRYDQFGNVIEQRLYGNLSGKSAGTITINQEGIPQGAEYASTSYTYEPDIEKDSFRLTGKTEPSGKTTVFSYDPLTGRNTALFIGDQNGFFLRQFFSYNEDGLPIKTVTDNGSGTHPGDLAGVTEIYTARFTLIEGESGRGMPEIIEESIFDRESGSETLIRKTINSYSQENRLIKQDFYDKYDAYVYSNVLDYDFSGRCIYSKDADGKEIFREYNLRGDLTGETERKQNGESRETKNFYDIAGRLVRTTVTDGSGSQIGNTFHYNHMNYRTAVFDHLGNETQYQYDELGRQTAIIYPEVSNGEKGPGRPTIRNMYDYADNIIECVDPNGFKTNTTYNARKSPTEIRYPDGTKENFIYHPDGTLAKKTEKTGVSVSYSRDCLGRVIHEETLDSEGVSRFHVTHVYNGFHLLSSLHSNGIEEHYHYLAGNLVKKETMTSEGIDTVEYEYDNLGRQSEVKTIFGESPSDYYVTKTERDIAGNILCVKVEDSNGKLVRFKENTPDDSSENFENDYQNFYSSDNLHQFEKSIVDKAGNTITTKINALGKIISVMKKDCFGKIFQEISYEYDLAGNKVKESHAIFENGKKTGTYKIVTKYGPCNRIDMIIEGEGSTSPRCYNYKYTSNGLQKSIMKPDGMQIQYEYDALGLPIRFFSSDGTISYEYSYDESGNVSHVLDAVTGNSSDKSYNAFNLLCSETLGNGITIVYQYDKAGRLTDYILSDGSSVKYIYDSVNVKEVRRIHANNKTSYSHLYLEYDLSGRVLREQLIGDAGNVNYMYNDDGYCTEIQTPYFNQSLTFDSQNNINSLSTADEKGTDSTEMRYNSDSFLTAESGNIPMKYSYDSLGNITAKNGEEFTITHNCEISSSGDTEFSYDINGNMIKKVSENSSYKYSYDALNRLSSVLVDDSLIVTFTYDSLNRRLEKIVTDKKNPENSSHTRYIYRGNEEVGTTDQEGIIDTFRVLGAPSQSNVGSTISIEIENTVYTPLKDIKDNIRSLVNIENNEIAESYEFTGFGEEEIFTENENTALNPWRFAAKRTDPETGLVYFGKRYYMPEIGRWTSRDPIGFEDGINRYVFTHNNPIKNRDLYGMYSLSSAKADLLSFVGSCISTIQNLGDKIHPYIMYGLDFIQKLEPDFDDSFESFFGKGFLTLMGYYPSGPESGVYGQGEVNDKIRITLINGILNNRSYYSESLQLFSSTHGGANIHYIFRPSKGWVKDVINGVFIKCGYVSPYATHLANTWKSLIEEMGGVDGGGSIIHYCHSLGGADTIIAASLLTPEERRMIRVFSFGSASIIPGSLGFAEVKNYISRRDGVCLLTDPGGYYNAWKGNNGNVIFIGSTMGIPLVDHTLAMESYSTYLTNLGHIFLQMYANEM